MKRAIFLFPFHFYMNAGHVLHTHESAASATHTHACDTYVRVRDPHAKKPDRNNKSRTHNPKLLLCYFVQENISMGYSGALNLVCNIEICVFLTRSVPLYYISAQVCLRVCTRMCDARVLSLSWNVLWRNFKKFPLNCIFYKLAQSRCIASMGPHYG